MRYVACPSLRLPRPPPFVLFSFPFLALPRARLLVLRGPRLDVHCSHGAQLMSITATGEGRIATYDPTPREIAEVGHAYAYLQYTFPEEALLRDALLALCLNRWVDWRGF